MPSGDSTRQRARTEVLRAQIWDLFLGENGRPGLNQYQIADKLGCTQQNVSAHIIKSITKLEYANATRAEQYLSRELKVCALGEAKAWKHEAIAYRAWRQSGGTVKTTRKEGKPAKVGEAITIEGGKVTVFEETLVGNPKFLAEARFAREEAMKWHERRCKLLGLDAPQKVKIVDESDPAMLPDSELEKAVMRMAASLNTGIMVSQPGNNGNANGNGHNGNGKLN